MRLGSALRRPFFWVLLSLFWLLIGCALSNPKWATIFARHPHAGHDFEGFYASIVSLRAIGDCYSDRHVHYIEAYYPSVRADSSNPNPPPFFLLMLPLSMLSQFDALLVFNALGTAFFVATTYLWCRRLLSLGPLSCGLVVLGWGSLLPMSGVGLDEYMLGQLGFFLGGSFALAWLADDDGRPAVAGFWLSLAIWMKLWPILLAVYFARMRHWRTLGWCLGWGALQALASLLLWGPHCWAAWLQRLELVREGTQGNWPSHSLTTLLIRFCGFQPSTASLVDLEGLTCVLVIYWLYAMPACQDRGGMQVRALAFCQLVLVCLIFNPYTWPSYQPVNILLWVSLAGFLTTTQDPPFGRFTSFLVFLTLNTVGAIFILDGEIVTSRLLLAIHNAYMRWFPAALHLLAILGMTWWIQLRVLTAHDDRDALQDEESGSDEEELRVAEE